MLKATTLWHLNLNTLSYFLSWIKLDIKQSDLHTRSQESECNLQSYSFPTKQNTMSENASSHSIKGVSQPNTRSPQQKNPTSQTQLVTKSTLNVPTNQWLVDREVQQLQPRSSAFGREVIQSLFRQHNMSQAFTGTRGRRTRRRQKEKHITYYIES